MRVVVALVMLAACGHRETAPRPVANAVPAAPPDASAPASPDACASFLETLERAKGCDNVSARSLLHFDNVVQEINHDYTGSHSTKAAMLRYCADETSKLVAIVKAPCGW